MPFDEDTTAFIARLDPDRDVALLRERGIRLRPASERIFKAANMVLKKVAAAGLPPKAAADILERQTLRKSTMEKMHRCAARAQNARASLVPLCSVSISTSAHARVMFKAARRACRVASERGVREEEEELEVGRCALVPLLRSSSAPATPRSSTSGAVPVSDAVYLRHLSALLDEYLEDIAPEDVLA